MNPMRNVTVSTLVLLAFLPLSAFGQDFAAPPPDGAPQPLAAPPGYAQPADTAPQPLADPSAYAQPADMSPPGAPQPLAVPLAGQPPGLQAAPQPAQPVAYSQQQIDQMLAPIALYPDPLISQILMASTYPLEIVEAQRWRQNPQNAQLSGPALQAALDQQPWDPSVKSLVAFPQVLNMLDSNIPWTEQLGDAFLASQPAVMDSIQRLRQMAHNSGNLNSTPQQVVSQQQGDFVIQPAQPQVVYVPYYNPMVVYGAWPYPAYAPYYFPPPPGVVFIGALGFGIGLAVVDWLWGWNHWDWRNHRIIIDGGRFATLNRGIAPGFAGGAWAHDVSHRHGVPYRTAGVRAQFQGAANDARRANFRGFASPAATPRTNVSANFAQTNAAGRGMPANSRFIDHPASPTAPTQPHVSAPATERPAERPQASSGFARPQAAAARPAQSHAAPMFESFSRGPEVRTQSARGSTSRASMPSARSAPAASRGGGGGGHDSGQNGRNR